MSSRRYRDEQCPNEQQDLYACLLNANLSCDGLPLESEVCAREAAALDRCDVDFHNLCTAWSLCDGRSEAEAAQRRQECLGAPNPLHGDVEHCADQRDELLGCLSRTLQCDVVPGANPECLTEKEALRACDAGVADAGRP